MGKRSSVYIWQFTALQFSKKIWIEGTLIYGNQGERKVHTTWIGHFIEVFLSYFRKPAAREELKIRTGTEEITLQTDSKGGFSCLLSHFEMDELQISHYGELLELPGGYPAYFPQNDSSLATFSSKCK